MDKIIKTTREKSKFNQWKSSKNVIDWFLNLADKNECTFMTFDIVDFYPSISKDLLLKAINFAKYYTPIYKDEIKIIMHARRSLLFNNGEAWIKRNGDESFDVSQGSWDSAECSELVGLFLLSQIHTLIALENVGLYRDDGLAVLRNTNGPQCEKIKKNLIAIFKSHGLKIEISISKIANFLDLKFDLNSNTFKTYNKPNNQPLYVNSKSNHPPSIIKQIPKSISKRISDNSCNIQVFQESAPFYNNLLTDSGYTEKLSFSPRSNNKKTCRKRKILWYNPPFSLNVQSNIGKCFLKLITKHFGNKENKLNKIFNKNNVKISYRCMDNIEKIIKTHNKNILSKTTTNNHSCNCQRKDQCPLDGNCDVKNVIYAAHVTTLSTANNPRNPTPNHEPRTTRQTRTRHHLEHDPPTTNQNTTSNDVTASATLPAETTYIGAAENFKARYRNHLKSFNNIRYEKDTELSKSILIDIHFDI